MIIPAIPMERFQYAGLWFNESQAETEGLKRVLFIDSESPFKMFRDFPTKDTASRDEAAQWILDNYFKYCACAHEWDDIMPNIARCEMCGAVVEAKYSERDQQIMASLNKQLNEVLSRGSFPDFGNEYSEEQKKERVM